MQLEAKPNASLLSEEFEFLEPRFEENISEKFSNKFGSRLMTITAAPPRLTQLT